MTARSGYGELPAIWLNQITDYSDHCVFWVVRGRALVWADDRAYQVGESEALWLPAGTTVGPFQTEAGSVALFTLIPRRHTGATPSHVVRYDLDAAASDALVVAYVRWVMPFWVDGHAADAFAAISRSSDVEGTVGYPPVPDHVPALQVATALLQDPADTATAREWAARTGTSERSLTRSFLSGTGMTFSAWRTSLRIAHAVRLLHEGLTPRHVAPAVGYSSTAAFDHAFRRATGVTPSRAQDLARGPDDVAPASRTVPWPSVDGVLGRHRVRQVGGPTSRPEPPVAPPAAVTWPRISDMHVLVWMFRGRGAVEIGADDVRLDEGEAVWLPAGVSCRVRTEDGGIVVPVGHLPGHRALMRGSTVAFRIPPERAPEMLYRSAASHTCLRPDPHHPEHMADLVAAPGSPAVSARRHPTDPVDHVLAALPSDARTIRDWAAALGVSTDRLAGRFRARTGQSFREWRGDRRMTVARDLLTRPGTTPGHVAHELGYSQVSAFTRAFTQRHETTPTAFQQKFRHVAHVVADDDPAIRSPDAVS